MKLTFDFQVFPEIRTQRLYLRRMLPEDADALHSIRNMEQVMQYIARPRSKTRDEALQLIHKINELIDQNEAITWAITTTEQPDQLIGTMGFYRTKFEDFRSEIGYLLHPDFWRKGIMTEAIRATLHFGFHTLGLHSVEACIDPQNEGSRAVLLKCGFRHEASFKENFFYEGRFLDTDILGILKREFDQMERNLVM